MIGFLRGKILSVENGRLTLGVGSEDNIVGYEIHIAACPSADAFLTGEVASLHIHTHVREDALDLYGFASPVDRELFLTLIQVNGIGPKLALGILSNIPTHSLIDAIREKNQAALVALPGIGKKMAERILLELAAPVEKKFGHLPQASGARPLAATSASTSPSQIRDAEAALVELGLRQPEARQRIDAVLARQEVSAPPLKTEEIIRAALRGQPL